MKKILFPLLLLISITTCFAQDSSNDIFAADDDDLNIGGDIFTDFSEDVENAQVVEDERFYRFGRFFCFNVSLGITTFDGNRGLAYTNSPPTFGLSYTFFKDFQTALTLGLEMSQHSMYFPHPTKAYSNTAKTSGPGLINVSLLRVFLGYRYYIETSNFGTAITYSNPYLIGRMEYWYQTNKFVTQTSYPPETGGGLGFALGGGLEFPIELKETYWGVEFLMHSVSFFDKNTTNYSPKTAGDYGFEDLGGNVYSLMVSYVFNW